MKATFTGRIPRVAALYVCQDQAVNEAVRRFRKVWPYDEPCLRRYEERIALQAIWKSQLDVLVAGSDDKPTQARK